MSYFSSGGQAKTKHNELAPVSFLPPELLSKIFELCIRNEIGAAHCKALATITWVSDHWRAVALDDASLWTNVWVCPCQWLLGSKWRDVFLQRSKTASLSVVMSHHRSSLRVHHEQVKALLSQMSRIVSITLVTADSAFVGDTLAAKLDSPPLLLDFLQIDHVSTGDHPALKGHGMAAKFLHMQAPRLRRLVFMDFAFPWNSSVYHTVTSINIGFFDSSPPFKTLELYQGIKAISSQLRELHFDFTIDLKADATYYHPIALPQLEKITLKREEKDSLCLLRLLHLPESVSLHLVY